MVTAAKPPAWARKVDELLEAQGHTRHWLAEQMEISPSLLTKKMGGDRPTRNSELHFIAQTLGIPVHWLQDTANA